MNRSEHPSVLSGKPPMATAAPFAALPVTGLTPYTGPWEFAQAAHLLRRATFGPTYEQIQNAVGEGLDATVAQLLTDQPLPAPPINYNFDADPYVAVGETWINAPYAESVAGESRMTRGRSLFAWTLRQILDEGVSIREKMTLFWHNHFAIEKEKVQDPKYIYKYITLLRSAALGNFRQLVKDVTIDPSMLYYLDGRQNLEGNPNENYARELLELFTVGKGPVAGPGDYTTFTEDDVIAMARILTGWRDMGRLSSTVAEVYSEFLPDRHDTSGKQLSPRFGNAIIQNADNQEYSNLIDVIFEQEVVSLYICRKIYRWLVNFDITGPVEAEVIVPLAQCLRDNAYEIKPVIEVLLKSQHFYEAVICGAIIKNPLEFVFSILKQFSFQLPAEPPRWYHLLLKLSDFMVELDMDYYAPPSVAGWTAYYLEPQFYQQWINAVTLRPRMTFSDNMALTGFNDGQINYRLDVLGFVATLAEPLDPNSLIDEISRIIFPEPITQNQKDYLKSILIPGLPDFEWTVEYSAYTSEPDNADLAMSVEARLRNLLRAMLNMPEFHLC